MRRLVVLSALLLIPAGAMAGYRVSSFKKETKLGANYWNAKSAIDEDLETCWMVDPESTNTGEWLELDLPKSTVTGLKIMTGWGKDEDHFKDYGRLKKVKVQIYSSAGGKDAMVGEKVVEFTDSFEFQTAELPASAVGDELNGGRIRLTVEEIYPGKDYPTLGVSEVLVRLEEKDAPAKMTGDPSSAAEGHEGALVSDDDAKTFWAARSGEEESISVIAMDWGVSSVGIQAGPASHARPKKVRVTVANQRKEVELENSDKLQWVELPAINGFAGSAWGAVEVEVLESYPGSEEGNGVGIAEIKLKATNYEG